MDCNQNELSENNIKSKSVIKKVGAAFVIILLMGLGQAIGKIFTAANNNSLSVEFSLETLSEGINKELPVMIDADTQLTNVVSSKKSLTLYYKVVTYTLQEIDVNGMRGVLAQSLKNSFCSNPDYEFFRKNGATFKYTYHDQNDTYITSFNFDNSDCI